MNVKTWMTCVAIGWLVAGLAGCSKPSDQAAAPAVGSAEGSALRVVVGAEQFKAEVMDAELPVLVDFWATWCPPCKFMNPIIAETAEHQQGVLKVAKVDVDDNQELAAEYNIRAIPTLMIFHRGKVIAQYEGAMREAALNDWLQNQLKSIGVALAAPVP